MTEELVLDWVKSVWCRRPGALLARRSMLVLDAFRGHLTEGVKKLIDNRTELVVIPGGLTSQLQPLDVCLNKPFKAHVRRLYNEWMASDTVALTPSGRISGRPHPCSPSGWSTLGQRSPKPWLRHRSASAAFQMLLMAQRTTTSVSAQVIRKIPIPPPLKIV